MKKDISAAVLSLVLMLPGITYADIATVTVPDSCTVTDTEGGEHTYGGQFLGVCALAAAKEQGIVADYALQNFSFGLFLQSLNGIVPDATEFWSVSQNGTDAAVGLSDLVLAENDTLGFQLTDWSTNTAVGSPISFQIALLASAPKKQASSEGGGGEFLEERHFNVESAFDFLVSKQDADGSFGSPMLTDWAAITFGTATDEVCNDACPAAREKLRAYVANMAVSTSSATDIERHIMALEALALDPYAAPGSLIDELAAKFDGTQIGEPSLVNDDIFAIFPLLNAGYAKNDPMMTVIVSSILSKQHTNGSWEESIDLTAAAIQALVIFPGNPETTSATARAKEFLRRNQDDSGIFGKSSFTLSWVLQAIAALGETAQEWKKSGVTPLGYLGVLQQDDGGMEPRSVSEETRVWATAYAIPAAFGRPWDAILIDFSRPTPPLLAPPPPIVETMTPLHESVIAPAPLPESVEAAPASLATSSKAASTTTSETMNSVRVVAAAESAKVRVGAWLWLVGLLLVIGAGALVLRKS